MTKVDARAGQVVVEMLLILPVFLTMVFLVMEIGYISFRLIVLNHAAYEAARVGGMVWAVDSMHGKVQEVFEKLIPSVRTGDASLSCAPSDTMSDPQAGQMNADLECTATERVKLIFPLSSIILAKPARSGKREIQVTIRMPIERPLMK